MDASKNNMLRLISGPDKKFIIPVYQRPYSWKKKNCEQLLKDLKEVYERKHQSHFFGSVVYVSENNGSCQEFIIIDGQQRITTVSMLLLAIRNYVLKHPELDVKSINTKKIKNAYLTDEYADNAKKLKLKLIQNDDDAYNSLIEGKQPIEDTSITSNYNYFYSEIGKMTAPELEGVYNAISTLDIVSISLKPEDGDDPQLIFESLNSTGLDLETADKIRNYVLMNMKNKEQEKFYRDYWEPLEQTVGHSEINKFIRFYLANKTRRLYDEKKLYFEFKYYREGSGLSLESILQDMLEYAGYYREITAADKNSTPYSDILKRIGKLDVKTCVPLIMDLFKARSGGYISDEELRKALEVIENFIVRREVCDLPTNALNKLFVQVGAEVDKDVNDEDISYYDAFCRELLSKTGRSRFPNNHEFRERFESYDLYNAKPGMRKYILERLENFSIRELVDVEKLVDNKTLTIEHVMPQTLSDEWKKQLGENWELIQTKYLNTPGNLTLTAYNSDYSNSPFEKKKTMPEKGFLFSKLTLNDYIKTCDSWGEEQIRERAGILYQKAEKIWWMPSVADTDGDAKPEWVSWDEDADVTSKLVTQVEVMGTLINTKDMSNAYRKIHAVLFELDPTIYYNSGFSWFGKSKTDVRKAWKLTDNAYIETNKSSQDKMNAIKAVCEAMELDSDDVRLLIGDKPVKATFDIDDESTYGSIKIGKLAYEIFGKLVHDGLIFKEEVQSLKTKEHTKELFRHTDYPALADRRDANKGNSSHIRYRKNPLIFEGKELYVTTQWFDDDRDAIVQWYKSHLR